MIICTIDFVSSLLGLIVINVNCNEQDLLFCYPCMSAGTTEHSVLSAGATDYSVLSAGATEHSVLSACATKHSVLSGGARELALRSDCPFDGILSSVCRSTQFCLTDH